MAFPNELGVGRINRLLQRVLQIKGGAPAPVLVPELQANLILENDRPEYGWLTGENRFGAYRNQALLAGNRSHVLLVNPANSGTLVVVQRIRTDVDAVISVDGTPTGATPTPGFGRDLRREKLQDATTKRSVCTVASGNQVAAVGSLLWLLAANGELDADDLLIMNPNAQLVVQSVAVAVALQVTLLWKERALEASEGV